LIEKEVEMIAMNHNLHSADETYRDVEKLIYKMSWQAARRYGGDWEDYASAANGAFMDAFTSYDASQGTAFSTWLYWKIKGAVLHEIRKSTDQLHREDVDVNTVSCRCHFDFDEFVSELSYDARTVVTMIVESPLEVYNLLHHKDIGSVLRGGLQHQLGSIGWSVARMSESFSEIRKALE
jgi:DNA-directed RNA polymerase specialized sigma24 family protein